MLGDMDAVTTWADETEVLLDEFDKKEKQLMDLDGGKSKTGESGQEEGKEVKEETKKERMERIKEEKVQVREEMTTLVGKLAVSTERLNF